jgi:cyclohexa-1,5-dienecarbonyl-CoA hydratase
MTKNEWVSLTGAEDLRRITLCRPPLNFLNLEMLTQFLEHLDALGEDPPCRALVLDAEGTAFSAGLELVEQTKNDIFLLLEQFHHVARALNSFPRPTIALVRGMAIGAGNELLACCDFVYAGEKASFGQPEIKMGSMPSLAPLIFPPLMGSRKMVEMILTGNLLTARDAEQIGLINRVLPEDQLSSMADELLKTFRNLSSPVLSLVLSVARRTRTSELDDNLRKSEALYLNELMELEDPEEGVRAFIEKRHPKWKNR